jgi:hypothetical protein
MHGKEARPALPCLCLAPPPQRPASSGLDRLCQDPSTEQVTPAFLSTIFREPRPPVMTLTVPENRWASPPCPRMLSLSASHDLSLDGPDLLGSLVPVLGVQLSALHPILGVRVSPGSCRLSTKGPSRDTGHHQPAVTLGSHFAEMLLGWEAPRLSMMSSLACQALSQSPPIFPLTLKAAWELEAMLPFYRWED